MMIILWSVGFCPIFWASWFLVFSSYTYVGFAGVLWTVFGPPFALRVTPSVSRVLIVIETSYFEVFISFHSECSRLTFLCTYYGNVEPAPGGCRYTLELSLLMILGLAQPRWFGNLECHPLLL